MDGHESVCSVGEGISEDLWRGDQEREKVGVRGGGIERAGVCGDGGDGGVSKCGELGAIGGL